MESAFIRSFLVLSALLALSACSKDQGALKQQTPQLFKGRLMVDPTDDFTLKSEGDGIPTGLASNKNNFLWACGNITKTGIPARAIVRFSDDYGGPQSWKIVSDSDGPTHEGAFNSAIATDGVGNVYVAQTYNSGTLSVASILFSVDGGLTWKNADYETPGLKSSLKSVTLSPNGVPYFTGVSSGDGSKQGFVLTLENGKAKLLSSYNNSEINQVAAKTSGEYYVVGSDLTDQTSPVWFFGKDPSGESDLKNPFQTGSPFLGSADVIMIMTVKEGDQLKSYTYTGGTDNTSSSWIIKKSSDGINFTDVDKFHGHFKTNVSISALIDFNGRPFAVGGGQDANGHSHWILRYAEGNTRWRTLATFNQSADPNFLAKAVGIASIVNNNQLAVLGKSHDAVGYHWKLMRISEHGFSTNH